MSDEIRNKDDAKGRVKEAAGSLTGDDDLKREGKVDKASGAVKDGVEQGLRQGQGRRRQGPRLAASGRGPRAGGGGGRRRRGRPPR